MRTFGCSWHLLLAAICGLALSSGVAHAQKVVRIGAALELSGKMVAYGNAILRGMEMATDAFGGSVAGQKIEILARDIQSTNPGTISAMTDLLEKEKVDFIIGPVASGYVSVAVSPWRQRKPLWVVPGGTAAAFEQAVAGEPMVFHTQTMGHLYYASPARVLAAATGKSKKLAILYTDGGYGRSGIADATKIYTEAGFEIVAAEMVRENAADMNPALQKIKLAKPDVLLCIMQGSDGIVAAKQIHVAKLGIPYLAGTGFPAFSYFSEAVGPDVAFGWTAGVTYLPGQSLPADPKYPKIFPAAKDWEAAFTKKYNREPETLDVTGYVSAAMLLLAIERAGGGDDRERVAKELRNLDVQTPLGQGKFTPTPGGIVNQAFNELMAAQRQTGGKLVILWPKSRATGEIKAIK